MSWRTLVVVLGAVVSGFTTSAQGQAIIELVPDRAPPYTPDQRLTVDVWSNNQSDADWRIKRVQFDFTDSDPAISLDPTFQFDFSSLFEGDEKFYLENLVEELLVPRTSNTIECWCPSQFLPLFMDQPFHMGEIGLRLPSELGMYTLDLLNADEPDELFGATIRVIYREPSGAHETWRAFTGELTGGVFDFVVEPRPIPATSTWGMCILILGFITAASIRLKSIAKKHSIMFQGLPRTTLLLALFLCCQANAQTGFIPTDTIDLSIDSGTIASPASGSGPVVIWSTDVNITDALWIRLHFDQVTLAGSPQTNDESFVRITSLADGAVQTLGSVALAQWGDASAYFNGDTVSVELLAYPGTGDNRIVIDKALIGIEQTGGVILSQCGPTDDRVPSTDVRSARIRYKVFRAQFPCLPDEVVCTGFLYRNRWFLNSRALL